MAARLSPVNKHVGTWPALRNQNAVASNGHELLQPLSRAEETSAALTWCGDRTVLTFVRKDDVRRLTKQLKLTAIIQSRRLTLFAHIMRMDDNADAKMILLVSPPADWRRQPSGPRIT